MDWKKQSWNWARYGVGGIGMKDMEFMNGFFCHIKMIKWFSCAILVQVALSMYHIYSTTSLQVGVDNKIYFMDFITVFNDVKFELDDRLSRAHLLD